MNDEMKPCPYYQGICGLDESYICYCAGYPNACEIYKKHEEDELNVLDKDMNVRSKRGE